VSIYNGHDQLTSNRPSLSLKEPTKITIKSIRTQIPRPPSVKNHEDSRADLAHIEAVNTNYAKEPREQCCSKPGLGANLVSELINRWLRWYLDNRRRDWRLSAFDNYFFGDGTFFVC